MASPIAFSNPILPCTPTTFQWTGGVAPFRLNVTAADPTANSGLLFGLSFDGLQDRQFTFGVPFPAGTSVSFNVLSSSNVNTTAPDSLQTSHFTMGGDSISDFSCGLSITQSGFSATNSGGSISLSNTDNSTESCQSNEFKWTGGTPPFNAKFSLQSEPLGNLVVTQSATINVGNINQNSISLKLPYDTGATIALHVSDGDTKTLTDPSLTKPIFISAGGSSSCFLQSSTASPNSSNNNNNNGNNKVSFKFQNVLGPVLGVSFLVVIYSSYRRYRARNAKVQGVIIAPPPPPPAMMVSTTRYQEETIRVM